MIEIRSNRAVAFGYDALKVGIYFLAIFYAGKIIYDYILKTLNYMIIEGMQADYSPLLFLMRMINALLENFFYDLIIILAFVFVYSLKNSFVFREGILYVYQGFLFVKERTIPYSSIREIDYEKSVFDTGNIIILLHEEKKPIRIPYVSRVLETYEKIKKETGFDNDKLISKQIQKMGAPAGTGRT